MYLTLAEYLDAAIRMLGKYGGPTNDEDAISYVAEEMMKADQRYEEGKGNRRGFRGMTGMYAVMKYKRRRKMPSLSYHAIAKGIAVKEHIDLLSDPKQNINDKLIASDIMKIAKATLTKKQYQYLNDYFSSINTSFDDVAKARGNTSRQNVQQSVQKSVKRLKEVLSEN